MLAKVRSTLNNQTLVAIAVGIVLYGLLRRFL